MDTVKNYFLAQLDKPTAWIGAIGLVLQFLSLQSFLFLLFVALIVLPEANFSDIFKKWTQKLRELETK